MNASLTSEGTVAPAVTPATAADSVGGELIGEGKAWGLSTAVDLQDCRPGTIRDAEHIKAYVVALCELIGMRRYGDCQIVHFGEGRVAGYSMIQLIETSLISGHFANDTNRAYLDIFSCKGYDPAVVEAFSKRFFGAKTSTSSVTLRY
ncbi:MAG TPA: S-adenosylmethionine decarboxylase [Nitrospiraceae bacterium]|nr:S-adenosylmethionine decarboxylase [Nitrospiraceae bacterium]